MKRIIFTLCFIFMAAPSIAADRFTQIDTDKDGILGWNEFSAALPNMRQKAFDTIDTDKNGSLSKAEWNAFFSTHGMKKSEMRKMPLDTACDVAPVIPAQSSKPLITPPRQ